VKIEPGQTAGAGFEFAAIALPIDKQRPHQRRQQRQDDRDRETEERRLHAVTTAGLPPGPRIRRRPGKA
jgi:hypothetical protein